jgi:hypothetical protein
MACVAIPDARIVAMQDEDVEGAADGAEDSGDAANTESSPPTSIFASSRRVIVDLGLRKGFSDATVVVETLKGLAPAVPNPDAMDSALALAAGELGGYFSFRASAGSQPS